MDTATPLCDTPDQSTKEVTAHHEAGHAVMARLFGRRVHKIVLDLNVQGTHNGSTHWDRDEIMREWDQNIPYNELGLRQEESNDAVALIFAAGKAAERIWYRQRGLDETLASFGTGGQFDDERELEKELLTNYRWVTAEKLPQRKQAAVELAMRLLGARVCWQAVEAVAQELLERLKQTPNSFMLEDVQNCIADVFAQAALNDFERHYTAEFEQFASQFGEFVSYRRDRAARDIGLQFTRKLQSGNEAVTSALCWFQLKGITKDKLSRDKFCDMEEIKFSLEVSHLVFWYVQPTTTYLVLYIESIGIFLILDIQKYIKETWGNEILSVHQKEKTISIPTKSFLQPEVFLLLSK